MTLPGEWTRGEVAVLGLGKSGVGATTLLSRGGARVYASDAGTSELARAGAAALSSLEGVAVDAGKHDLDRIRRASLVVASPGIPPDAPPLAAAREAGVPIVSEIEIALRFLRGTRYVAVTGTNGKTTTTALIGHLLRALGYDAPDAGNIGTPLSEIALKERPPSWVALELSSFQLHDTPSVNPAVGVLTNLSPDHLDRYADVDAYFADKALLFRNAGPDSAWVVNADDPPSLRMIARVAGAHHHFSIRRALSKMAEAWYWRGMPSRESIDAIPAVMLEDVGGLVDAVPPSQIEQPALMWDRHRLVGREELHLLGDHNVANALAACLAVIVADELHRRPEALARIGDGLRTFRALKHRLESAGEFGGVLWINDSKATNVSSTLVAVQGMTRPTVVLLGGRHKGEPYTALAGPLKRIAKAVIAYGEAAPIVEADLGSQVRVERLGSDFEEVIARARALAAPGDAVLLSPACSSYDMFNNYEERGAAFKRLAAGT